MRLLFPQLIQVEIEFPVSKNIVDDRVFLIAQVAFSLGEVFNTPE
jgi:hypothetical protein